MKKVIFSAVAMIAFVGSSMASGEADEKEIIVNDFAKEICKENTNKKVLTLDCDLVKLRIYNIAIDKGYTAKQATAYSYTAYFECKSKNLEEMDNGLSQD